MKYAASRVVRPGAGFCVACLSSAFSVRFSSTRLASVDMLNLPLIFRGLDSSVGPTAPRYVACFKVRCLELSVSSGVSWYSTNSRMSMSSDFFRGVSLFLPPVVLRTSLLSFLKTCGDPRYSFLLMRYMELDMREYLTDSLVELAFSLLASWSLNLRMKWNSESSWSIAKVVSSI